MTHLVLVLILGVVLGLLIIQEMTSVQVVFIVHSTSVLWLSDHLVHSTRTSNGTEELSLPIQHLDCQWDLKAVAGIP